MKPSASELTGKLRRLSARIWNPKSGGEKGHRLAASLAEGEEEWDPDQPQIRMSRAFAVMLILHLVAVGGLFAFHIFGKDDQNAEQLATRQAHANATPPPAPRAVPVGDAGHTAGSPASVVPAGTTPPRAEVVGEDTMVDKNGVQYQVHTMLPGETKMLVAAKFGTTVKELEEANPGVDLKPGAHLSIPQHQRVISAAPDSGNGGNPPLAVLAATNSDEPGAREFAKKEGAENPYQNYDSAAADAIPAPRAAPVSAKPAIGKAPEKTVAKSSEKTSARASEKNLSRDDADDERPAKSKAREQAAASQKPKPSAATATAGSRTHVMQKGDTIYNVAHRYGLSPAEVMRTNNISDPSKIPLGQVLKITVRR